MSTDPFLFDLEVRGYVPYPLETELAKHATTAVSRVGTFHDPHDLVLVVDRTSAEGLAGSAASPHRTSRRAGPFAMPLAEVLALAKTLPTSTLAPLARITVLEIADVPPSREDLDRLERYTSPVTGPVLLGAMYVDTSGPTVHTNDGGSPYSTGLVHANDLADIARRAYGAPRLDGPSTDPVALFTARTVAGITFVFSPVAGAALVGWNFHKTRRTGIGAAIAFGTFALVAMLSTASAFMSESGGFALMLPVSIAGIAAFTKLTQDQWGTPLRKANVGLAIVMGLVALVLYSLVVTGIAMTLGTRLD